MRLDLVRPAGPSAAAGLKTPRDGAASGRERRPRRRRLAPGAGHKTLVVSALIAAAKAEGGVFVGAGSHLRIMIFCRKPGSARSSALAPTSRTPLPRSCH